MASLRLAVAADHAGYRYKEEIKRFLTDRGHEVQEFGTHSEDPVDYPSIVRPAAEAVARGECDGGVVVGGTGNGEAIVANKVRGVRCALCWSAETARLAREHNDANMISIGQRVTSLETVLEIVDVWLSSTFREGRHARRLAQIEPDSQEDVP
jgi:ribose 5-phosphate isomerase B